MKYAIKVILLIVILVSLINLPLVYGQEETNLPSISIQPSMTYYSIKRLFEKLTEELQFTNKAKEKYYEDLIQKRLAELKYVVDKQYLDQVEKSTQRISYQVGILTDYVLLKKMNNKKQNLIDLYKGDKIILERLRDNYPANSGFWMLVQHTINSIDINLQKL